MSKTPNLITRLKKLHRDEHAILLVFAIAMEPLSQTNVRHFLRVCHWEVEGPDALVDLMGKPLREKLIQQGMLLNKSSRLICAPSIAEQLAREAVETGQYMDVCQWLMRHLGADRRGTVFEQNLNMGAMLYYRLCLYQNQVDELYALFQEQDFDSVRISNGLAHIVLDCFDVSWFSSLSEQMQWLFLSKFGERYGVIRRHSEFNQFFKGEVRAPFAETSPVMHYLEQKCADRTLNDEALYRLCAGWVFDVGRRPSAKILERVDDGWRKCILEAQSAYFNGQWPEARQSIETAITGARKDTRKRNFFFETWSSLLYLMQLVSSDRPEDHTLFEKLSKPLLRQRPYHVVGECVSILQSLCDVLRNNLNLEDQYRLSADQSHSSLEESTWVLLAVYWIKSEIEEDYLDLLVETLFLADYHQHFWCLVQCLELCRRYPDFEKQLSKNKRESYRLILLGVEKRDCPEHIVDFVLPQTEWQRALTALQNIGQGEKPKKPNTTTDARLIWVLESDWDGWKLQPIEQKMKKGGGWTKGRNVALKRLAETDQLSFLTKEDVALCRCIQDGQNYYGYREFYINMERAIHAMVGHPRVFWANDFNNPLSIEQATPDLNVQEKHNGIHIQLWTNLHADAVSRKYCICQLKDYQLIVVKIKEEHWKIAQILGEEGMLVPASAKESVMKSLGAITSHVAIQSDIGGQSLGAKALTPVSIPIMFLQPIEDGIKFNLRVCPLGIEGPDFDPGEGRKNVSADMNGERVYTTRQLQQEIDNAQGVIGQLTTLHGWESDAWNASPFEWEAKAEHALEAIGQLQELKDSVTCFWPQGEKIHVSKVQSPSSMQVRIGRNKDWFAVEGELKVDEQKVISLKELIGLVQGQEGRFIELDSGEYLNLSRQLYDRIRAIAQQGDKIHPLAIESLDNLVDGMNVEADEHWRNCRTQLKRAYEFEPQVPSSLQAQLRDYQLDGYQWLARLAKWGAGACLADDMGLGKTLQALTLVLSRAAEGPTLVLAPSSVCSNWLAEADRFAPTLNPIAYGEGDRQVVIDNLGPFDLLVCSYGLLTQDIAHLAEVHWCNVIADEAQALKNPQAKRTRAAFKLKADFRLATTGTPIENHLIELWSIFQFINPGLLGGREDFNRRFATPIESVQDRSAKHTLKQRVQPFILRRLKSDVLYELPSKTEITLTVPLSADERAFYEALRRQALANLSEKKEESERTQHLDVLAEIMRLRQAACHPQLVMPESSLNSSKLAALEDLLKELLENQHRALIFSQFVGHLKLVRELLDDMGVSYQYLDGSTRRKQRDNAVSEFQNGAGQVFLISLKAGGAGLNLTGADYVIHMDPWWNPAVEDQASDRAHRMGQSRPVTIYRLVSKGTIEEKILAMHGKKRDLATTLLSADELDGKLSLDDMLALLDQPL